MNRFHFSDTIGKLAAAIVAAAAELEDIKREASANIPTKSGGSYSYKYATLPGILQAVRPILQKHDLAVLQNASEGGNASVDISTMIVHSSGEYLVLDALPMPMGNTAQETGSAITYGRRYQLLAALGLAADDDDDGDDRDVRRERCLLDECWILTHGRCGAGGQRDADDQGADCRAGMVAEDPRAEERPGPSGAGHLDDSHVAEEPEHAES